MPPACTLCFKASLGSVSSFFSDSVATATCRLMIIHRVIIDDDMDVHGHSSGGGYEKFGIDPSRGAIVVVRPDSVTGAIAPLQKIEALDEYFDGFLLPALVS